MNKNKIFYWGSTGLLSAMMLGSATVYMVKSGDVAQTYTMLGYPAYIMYPNAAAKVLGVLAILTKKSKFLKNLAYAGFFYLFILATLAHVMIGDGEWPGALMAMILLIVSYTYDKKLFK